MNYPSVTCKGLVLKQALAAAKRALPRNSPAQHLNLAVLHLDPLSGCYVHATNGNQRIVAAMPDVKTEAAPTDILLNDACIRCIETARDDEDVRITVKPLASTRQEVFDEGQPNEHRVDYFLDSVAIQLDHSQYRLDVRHYDIPTPLVADWDNHVEFQRGDFDGMVRVLGGVFDESCSDFDMSGIRLSPCDEPGRITAAATDGRRIGIGEFPATIHGDVLDQERVIPRGLTKIARSIDNDANALITFSERSCFIRLADIVCEGALSTGAFPSVASTLDRMDTQGTHVGHVDRGALIYGLRMSAITTSRPLDAVGVEISSKVSSLVFRSQSPDRGKSFVVRDSGITEFFSIVVDPTFLIPVLEALDTPTVSMRVLDDRALQVSTPDFRFVVAGISK